jgi:hypothetical protein
MEPPAKKDGRKAVSRELTRHTLDPMSALLAGLLQPSTEAACSGRTPVFDGRRRYDLMPKPVGSEHLPPPRAGAFTGVALHCEIYVERIAGYSKKADTSARKAGEPEFEVWFAKMPEIGLLLPAKVYADTRYGEVVATLARLEKDGRPVDLQAR